MYASQCLATNTYFPDLDEHIKRLGKTDLNGVGKGEKTFYLRKNVSDNVCVKRVLLRKVVSRERKKDFRRASLKIFMEISANTYARKYQRESSITDTTKAILCIAVRILCALFRLYSAGVSLLEYIEL